MCILKFRLHICSNKMYSRYLKWFLSSSPYILLVSRLRIFSQVFSEARLSFQILCNNLRTAVACSANSFFNKTFSIRLHVLLQRTYAFNSQTSQQVPNENVSLAKHHNRQFLNPFACFSASRGRTPEKVSDPNPRPRTALGSTGKHGST